MEYTIKVYPSCFMTGFKMTIEVPIDEDPEEYIDAYLDAILNEDLKYNCEWEFV